MKWFLAGVMAGATSAQSSGKKTINLSEYESQDYRALLAKLIREVDPDADIFDPLVEIDKYAREHLGKDLANSNGGAEPFDDDNAIRAVVAMNLAAIRKSDVLIAFLPNVSMGTAVEMNAAFDSKVTVYSITPLRANWTIRMCSTAIFPDMDAFALFLRTQFNANIASNKEK